MSSDCSLPELESLRTEYEKEFEKESSDAEMLQEKYGKDLHTSDDEQDSHEENVSETERTLRRKLRLWALAF